MRSFLPFLRHATLSMHTAMVASIGSLTILCMSLSLSGCANFQNLLPKAVALDAKALDTGKGGAQIGADLAQAAWWQSLGDPQLDTLMSRALQTNPSLAAAQYRIERAQAAAGLVQANSAPQVGAAGDLSYGRYSENYQVPKPPIGKAGQNVGQGRIGLDFSVDLDLWGKNAALLRAATAQMNAASFDRDAAHLALTTSIARTYVQLAAQYALSDVLQDTLKQRGAIRDLARQRVASGLDTQVELMQSTANQAGLRAEIVQLDTTMAVTRLQLLALVGVLPSEPMTITRPQMAAANVLIPAQLPLDLLGRRPELAAQRARIAAAVGDADQARAQFYPNINLAGFIGMQSFGLGQLLAAGSVTDSVGPALRLPIFDGGRLRANFALRTTDIDIAISQYNQSVLNAVQDAGEVLTRANALQREEDASNAALIAIREAYRLAMLRYEGGIASYLTVLTVESQLLLQRRAMLELQLRRQESLIGLHRAFGGGFQTIQ